MKMLALVCCFTPIVAVAAPPASFDQISKAASQAREQNRLEEAVKLYGQAVKLRPSWEEGWWYLGTLHYEKDQYAECRDAFRRFIKLNAKAGEAFALLGLCEFQTRDFDAALAHLHRATSLGLPENSRLTDVLHYHEALLLTRLENYERALFVLSMLARKRSVTPDIVAAAGIASLRKPLLPHELPLGDRDLAAKLGRAVLAAAERKPAEAQALFDEIVAAYPNTPNVHYAYGSFLLVSDPDKGVAEIQRELKISGEHLPALVTLAMEYLKRGEPENGRPYAERAVKAGPENFAARAALGRVLTDLGEVPAAIRELELAVKLAPDSPQVRIALASAYAKAGRKEDAARERAEFTRLRKLLDEGKAQ